MPTPWAKAFQSGDPIRYFEQEKEKLKAEPVVLKSSADEKMFPKERDLKGEALDLPISREERVLELDALKRIYNKEKRDWARKLYAEEIERIHKGMEEARE